MPQRTVFAKISGEQIGDGNPERRGFNANSIDAIADNVAGLYKEADNLGVAGITVVTGAGNSVRGKDFINRGIATGIADGLGRLATVLNALVIAEALESRGVPTARMLTPTMYIADQRSEFGIVPYNPFSMQMAHEQGRVALLLGGMGENKSTTDYAVARCAGESEGPRPTLLKATQFLMLIQEETRMHATIA
jgi:uridylate kinase